MKSLDCESPESTYSSLENILGLGKKTLQEIFSSIDFDHFYEEHPNYHKPADEVLSSIVLSRAPNDPVFNQVCWFHLTRVSLNSSFSQGIKPLGHAIEEIWIMPHNLAKGRISEEEWDNFQCAMGKSHWSHLYHMKTNDPFHWGPYAMLVKEAAFSPHEIGNHDYLDVPEIIEDICMSFTERYKFDLLGAFKRFTRPCIIKFTDPEARPDTLESALWYLYDVFHGNELSISSNTCFDGKGRVIPRERILQIEFFDNSS